MTALDIAGILGSWQDKELQALLAQLRRAVVDQDPHAAANFANGLRTFAAAKLIAFDELTEFARLHDIKPQS